MKRSSAFNEGFSFDPNDVTMPVKSKRKKRKKTQNAEQGGEDDGSKEGVVSESLSTIDLLIQNVMKEKKNFYSRISQHTLEQAYVSYHLYQ